MNTLPQIPCDWCKRLFSPTAEDFYQGGIEVVSVVDAVPGDEWKGEAATVERITDVTPEELPPAALAELKDAHALTDEEIRAMLAKRHIDGVGMAVCPECILASDHRDN